jgi:hypothetical protein
MTLSALIKKDGLADAMTAIPATTATQEAVQQVTVASVAPVAVAVKPEPLPKLTPDEETCIRAWLAYIEEKDADIIAEVLDLCSIDPDARQYFLKRSEEVPTQVITISTITKDEPESIAGLRDSDQRN